jgi:type I restriction enzyme M protein
LEGLEISELMLFQASFENRAFRIDSQYFAKAALLAETKLKAGRWEELHQLSSSVESFGAYALTNEFAYVDEGIPFLRCLNIKNGFTDFSDVLYVPETARSLLAKSEVKAGTVLLTMSGSVGNATVALPSWNYPINSNQDIAKITPQPGVNPYFLAAFIGSSYGRIQMARLPVGSVQQHIFLWMIERLVIARFSPKFELAIGNVVQTAYTTEGSSVEQISIAEQKLLRAINLENWQPPNPLSYTRSSAEAFAAGRFDAEHFKPKFAELIAYIENTGNAARLGSLLAVNDRGNQPEYAETGLPVVNSKHIANNDVRLDSDNRVGLASCAKVLIEPGDVLMNGTGVGTIGRSAPYLHAGKAIPDNHVTILRPKNTVVDPVYLSVFINSLAGQLQVEQRLHGSSGQIELYPTDIAEFTIWLAPKAIQEEIRQAVENGFAAKQRATQLLEAAKRAVEIAIEDSETTALAYLADFS